MLQQFTAAYLLCPLAARLLGRRRYARARPWLVGAVRVLMVHASHDEGLGYGPIPAGRFLAGRFLWRILLTTCAITQLWSTVALPLPPWPTLAVSLLCAADFCRRELPAACPAPAARLFPAPPGGPPLAASAAADAAWWLYPQAPGSFRRLAALLDWPLLHFLPGRGSIEEVAPVSDAALCAGVMPWGHLFFHVTLSTALAYALHRREGGGGQGRCAGGCTVFPVCGGGPVGGAPRRHC